MVVETNAPHVAWLWLNARTRRGRSCSCSCRLTLWEKIIYRYADRSIYLWSGPGAERRRNNRSAAAAAIEAAIIAPEPRQLRPAKREHRDVVPQHPQGAAPPGRAPPSPDGELAVIMEWASPVHLARRFFHDGRIINHDYSNRRCGTGRRLAGRGGPRPPQRRGSTPRKRRTAGRPVPVDNDGGVAAAKQVGDGQYLVDKASERGARGDIMMIIYVYRVLCCTCLCWRSDDHGRRWISGIFSRGEQ